MISVKDKKVLIGLMFVPFHTNMLELVDWLCDRIGEICITSGFRINNENSVHGAVPCRGLDLRSIIYQNPQGIVDMINAHWIYDPDRPNMKCAILHNTGSGFHIHLQVHDNTISTGNGGKSHA
jgi:hypothetical protein